MTEDEAYEIAKGIDTSCNLYSEAGAAIWSAYTRGVNDGCVAGFEMSADLERLRAQLAALNAERDDARRLFVEATKLMSEARSLIAAQS